MMILVPDAVVAQAWVLLTRPVPVGVMAGERRGESASWYFPPRQGTFPWSTCSDLLYTRVRGLEDRVLPLSGWDQEGYATHPRSWHQQGKM